MDVPPLPQTWDEDMAVDLDGFSFRPDAYSETHTGPDPSAMPPAQTSSPMDYGDTATGSADGFAPPPQAGTPNSFGNAATDPGNNSAGQQPLSREQVYRNNLANIAVLPVPAGGQYPVNADMSQLYQANLAKHSTSPISLGEQPLRHADTTQPWVPVSSMPSGILAEPANPQYPWAHSNDPDMVMSHMSPGGLAGNPNSTHMWAPSNNANIMSTDSLRMHAGTTVEGAESYCCEVCGQRFNNEQAFSAHKTYCKPDFANLENAKHTPGRTPPKNAKVVSPLSLCDHTEVLVDKEMLYCCGGCGRQFQSSRGRGNHARHCVAEPALQEHEDAGQTSPMRQYTSYGSQSPTPTSLDKDMQFTGEKGKSYRCVACGKQFGDLYPQIHSR